MGIIFTPGVIDRGNGPLVPGVFPSDPLLLSHGRHGRMVRRLGAAVCVAAATLVACNAPGQEVPDGAFAVVVNSDVAVGENRLLVGLLGPDGSRLGSPGLAVEVDAAPGNRAVEPRSASADFVWIVPDVTGLYRAIIDLPAPGPWQVSVSVGEQRLPPVEVFVNRESAVPWVGDPAPAPATPTLADSPIEALTTDPDPDQRFYEVSLADAIARGERTVLVFSTPSFCHTEACGPMLDVTKAVAEDHGDVTFIHVEVYEGFTEPDFVPDFEHLAPSAGPEHWNLPSEPWVFVIDEKGLVEARFEGVMEADELAAVLR